MRFHLCIVKIFVLLSSSILSFLVGHAQSGEIVTDNDQSNYKNISPSQIDLPTHSRIAGNLYAYVGNAKKTLNGQDPGWPIVGSYYQMPFRYTDKLRNKTADVQGRLSIGEVDGKAYIYFLATANCNCAAPLLPANETAVLTETPQVFVVKDFLKVRDDNITRQPCVSVFGGYYDNGGWRMKVSLSVDAHQNMILSASLAGVTKQPAYIQKAGTDNTIVTSTHDIVISNTTTGKPSDKVYEKEARVAPRQPSTAEVTEKIKHYEITGDVSLNEPADQKYIDRIRSEVEDIGTQLKYLTFLWNLKEADNFRVIKREANGLPAILRFDLIRGMKTGTWSNLEKYSIDVESKEGLPYLVYPGNNDYVFFARIFPADNFTETEKAKVRSMYNAYKRSARDSNPSYQAVLSKWESFPKEYNMKNCLAKVYHKEQNYSFSFKEDKPEGIMAIPAHSLEMEANGYVWIPSYKNISSHTVVIKGMSRSRMRYDEKGNYIYMDESLVLQPGAIVDFFKIEVTGFNEESEYNLQYWGDPGVIKIIPHPQEKGVRSLD